MMKKEPKARPPSKMEALATSVAKAWSNAHSAEIHSHCRVLQCEAMEIERGLTAMAGAMTNLRDRRARVAATLDGLGQVIAKRC